MSRMSRCLSSHVCRHGVLCMTNTQIHRLSVVRAHGPFRCSMHCGRAQKGSLKPPVPQAAGLKSVGGTQDD
eukprot:3367768-Alexandrium_andersonii.AAC.1